MKKIIILINCIFCICLSSCKHSTPISDQEKQTVPTQEETLEQDNEDDYTPVHIDAPVIKIEAYDVDHAIVTFEPVENANYYELYSRYIDEYKTEHLRSYRQSLKNTSIIVDCDVYNAEYSFYMIAYDKNPSDVHYNSAQYSQSKSSNTLSICLAECNNIETTKITNVTYVNDNSTLLEWYKLKGVDSYNVYYGTENNIETMQFAFNTSESYVIISNLDYKTRYYFSVKAVKNNEEKASSSIVSYNLSTDLPPVQNLSGSVTLIKKDGKKYALVTLKWDKSHGAERYSIYCSKLNNMRELTWYSNTNSFQKEISEEAINRKLYEGDLYKFEITAVGNYGKTYSSPKRSFYLRLSDQINKDNADGIIGLKIEESPAFPLKISWNKIDGITTYRLYYNSTSRDLQSASCEDIDGVSKDFYGNYGRKYYYFWLEPLNDNRDFPISSPVYGELAYSDTSSSEPSSGTSPGTTTSTWTKAYCISKVNFYKDEYESELNKANEYKKEAAVYRAQGKRNLADGAEASYERHMTLANVAKKQMEMWAERAKNATS